MRLALICFMVISLITGCSYPATQVRVVDDRPSIEVKGSPKDATLYVDGLNMGLASRFDGDPSVLLLEPGVHKVEITNHGRTLLSEKIFLGGNETKTISVISGESAQ